MGFFNREAMNDKAKKIAIPNAKVTGATVRVKQNARPFSENLVTTEDNVFDKCPACHGVIFADDMADNGKICPLCGHHFRLSARERIALTTEAFEEFHDNLVGKDPLRFPGYPEKIQGMRQKAGINEAIITGIGTIEGERAVLAVMDGAFMMGSMGAAVGEKFALAAERAIQEKLPLVAFTVSGGARMQEGLISLMQMAKTSAVLGKLSDAGLPYITVLTDPTTGGVTASFAMLGDIILAEPGALIGFAGRRVIEQTINQTLPPSFKRAEFLMEKGFLDCIVKRADIPKTLARIIRLHKGGRSK